MVRLRTGVTLVTLCVSGHALAQQPPAPTPTGPAQPQAPQDPYAPDPVLQEQIAEQLVGRAQELLDARLFLDAKQLAVEALVKSPRGNAADRARYIIRVVNQNLDIKDDPAPTPPSETPLQDQVDMRPISEPSAFDPSRDPPPAQAPPQDTTRDSTLALTVHSGLYAGILGATIGAAIGGDSPAAVAVPLGLATGAGGALLGRKLARKYDWTEAQVRTAGSFNLWGGVLGGLFAGAVQGADEYDGFGMLVTEHSPTARGVLLGTSIGSTLGLVAGGALARTQRLTRGDVALVDTLAGIGTVGGLTIGMLMQPAQPEAYAVNSLLGAAGGVLLGVIAGPQTNTTPRRMLRVAAFTAAGGAIPFLLYAGIYDSSTSADERVVGLLSSAGLLGGAYLGFRLTRKLDVGLDVHDGKRAEPDAPAALVGRNSDGSWSLGGLGLQPLSRSLATGQRGMGMTLLSGSF